MENNLCRGGHPKRWRSSRASICWDNLPAAPPTQKPVERHLLGSELEEVGGRSLSGDCSGAPPLGSEEAHVCDVGRASALSSPEQRSEDLRAVLSICVGFSEAKGRSPEVQSGGINDRWGTMLQVSGKEVLASHNLQSESEFTQTVHVSSGSGMT